MGSEVKILVAQARPGQATIFQLILKLVMLSRAGFEALETVTYKYHNFERDRIHKSWRKYSDDDLRSMIVFFIGKSNNASNR